MKDKHHYIIYDENLFIVKTFKYMCSELTNLLKSNSTYKWLNTTHPKNKSLLMDINTNNGTNL